MVAVGLLLGVTFSISQLDEYPAWSVGLHVAPTLTMLLGGGLLIAFRRRLSQRWFDDGPLELAIEPQSLLRLGLIIVGIAVAISAVDNLMYAALDPVFTTARNQALFQVAYDAPSLSVALPGLLAYSAQMVVGLLVAWFSTPLSRVLWNRQ